MTAQHKSYTIRSAIRRGTALQMAAFVVLSLSTAAASARPTTAPEGYQPGWQVDVRRADETLGQSYDTVIAQFTAPATGFDMGSYRAAASGQFDYGIAYDAQGLLNVTKGGPHRIAVSVGWTAGVPGPEASCRMSLTVEGQVVSEWKGPLSILAGERTQQGAADLKAGLHPARLSLACDGPVEKRVSAVLEIKTPSDRDLRPLGPLDIVHAGSSAPPPPAIADRAPPAAPSPRSLRNGTTLPPGGMTMIATSNLIVREQPDKYSPQLGRLRAGQSLQVAGRSPDGNWMALADGGFVLASFLRLPGGARPAPEMVPPPAPDDKQYRVGECRTYVIPASSDRRQPSVEGEACLQANGTWRVVR